MPLLDRRELIFEWATGQRFSPPTNVLHEVDVDVDDINNDNDIAEDNNFNDEIVDHIFEDFDSDEDTSAPTPKSINIEENDNMDIEEDNTSEHSIDTETNDNTDHSTHDCDAYNLTQGVLEDDIPPRRNPLRAAAGARITRLQPSFDS